MGIMPITAKKFSYPNLGFKPKAYTTQGASSALKVRHAQLVSLGPQKQDAELN